jgi:hypothetical protein
MGSGGSGSGFGSATLVPTLKKTNTNFGFITYISLKIVLFEQDSPFTLSIPQTKVRIEECRQFLKFLSTCRYHVNLQYFQH